MFKIFKWIDAYISDIMVCDISSRGIVMSSVVLIWLCIGAYIIGISLDTVFIVYFFIILLLALAVLVMIGGLWLTMDNRDSLTEEDIIDIKKRWLLFVEGLLLGPIAITYTILKHTLVITKEKLC